MSIFALVDCNNFYASCERVFQPKLNNEPIVILSNNDGCVIARSNEAKALGIGMGVPLFEVKHLIDKGRVHVFSSNYILYGDMSSRVMNILAFQGYEVEIYSIDEAFLKIIDNDRNQLKHEMLSLRSSILQWVGIPVSIGIGSTKTMSKLANHIAKKHTVEGVCSLLDEDARKYWYPKMDTSEIWGIGRKWSKKLKKLGIQTVSQYCEMDTYFIRKHFSVMGERIQNELQGISCYELETVEKKESIVSSTSFSQLSSNIKHIEQALSNYTARACEKLRKQGSKACGISVFIHTNYHRKQDVQHHESLACHLRQPSSNSSLFIRSAKQLLKKIYRPKHLYKKVGVMLFNITDTDFNQFDLFHEEVDAKKEGLMELVDSINRTFGKSTMTFAAEGTSQPLGMKNQYRSQRYTTQWDELIKVF